MRQHLSLPCTPISSVADIPILKQGAVTLIYFGNFRFYAVVTVIPVADFGLQVEAIQITSPEGLSYTVDICKMISTMR